MAQPTRQPLCCLCGQSVDVAAGRRVYCSQACAVAGNIGSQRAHERRRRRGQPALRSDSLAPFRALRLNLLAARAASGLPLFPLSAKELPHE